MTVIPDGYCEVQVGIRNTLNSHIASISLAFFADPDSAGVGNLKGVLDDALPDIAQDMHTEYTMFSYRFTYPDGSGGTGSVEVPAATGIDGANAGALMDPRSAMVVNKRSILLGRAGRGRFFLPGVVETDVDETGQFEDEFYSDVNNHLSSFYDKLLDPEAPLTTQPPYLLHNDEDMAPTALLGFTASRLVARIRRRI